MITTTLNRIREHHPCQTSWEELLSALGKTKADDEPLAYSKIVEVLGIHDAIWCCRAEPRYSKEWRLFAVWCARQVQHLMTDKRSIDSLDAAERYANGEATDKELKEAYDAAWAAAWESPFDAAWAAAWAAAWDDVSAASIAARASARAARASARADSMASGAWTSALSDARVSAWAAAWDAQTKKFLEIVGG